MAGFDGGGLAYALKPEPAGSPQGLRSMVPAPVREGDCHALFVYGTLRRGFELHRHLVRLGARFVTEAKVAAVLIDRQRYPGAWPSDRRGKWVCGELFQLRQPARGLEVLDRVEGFIPKAPQRAEFVRATVEVILRSGQRRRAWVYWLRARKFTGGLTWIV